MSEFLCPTHFEPLRGVLPGGAGHCAKCGLYVQAYGVPMPSLTPEVADTRAAAQVQRDQADLERARRKQAAIEKDTGVLASKAAHPKRKPRRTENATEAKLTRKRIGEGKKVLPEL